MKRLIILSASFFLFGLFACEKDNPNPPELDYTINIIEPTDDHTHVGDTKQIHISFKEENGGTIHHAQVRIYNKEDLTVVYSQPEHPEINEESGLYDVYGKYTFDVEKYSYWILEARVWGQEDGEDEVKKTMEFFVH